MAACPGGAAVQVQVQDAQQAGAGGPSTLTDSGLYNAAAMVAVMLHGAGVQLG